MPDRALLVVHVITDSGPHPYFRTLIEAGGFDRRALAVGCVGSAGSLQQEMRSLGVRTFALGAPSRTTYPLAVGRLVRLLRRYRTQIVQTHLVDGSLVGLAAARIARTPIAVMTAHHSHELPFHGRRLVWPERLCAGPLSDRIIAPSRDAAGALVRIARVPERKIEIVHHGFDLDRLDPGKVNGNAVRNELGLQGKLVFGAVGRIYALKNYPALVEAFAATLADVPEAVLVIVGPGDPGQLRTLASDLGIAERVLIAGPRNDIPEVLAAFDVFVHPAVAESFGMVIVEAMAMARPILSTPVGIAPDVIRDGTTGLLASGTDSGALKDGLLELVRMRSSWSEMGAAARREVEGYTASGMASRYAALYRTWLAG